MSVLGRGLCPLGRGQTVDGRGAAGFPTEAVPGAPADLMVGMTVSTREKQQPAFPGHRLGSSAQDIIWRTGVVCPSMHKTGKGAPGCTAGERRPGVTTGPPFPVLSTAGGRLGCRKEVCVCAQVCICVCLWLRLFLQEDPAGQEATSCWEQDPRREVLSQGHTACSGQSSSGQNWGEGFPQAWAPVSGTSPASLQEEGVTETQRGKELAWGPGCCFHSSLSCLQGGTPLALTPALPQPLRGSPSVSLCFGGTVP